LKTIGIKLADGSFFPVLQEGQPEQKKLELTTAHNNQTRVMVDLYRSESGSMDDAEYVDTLQIDNINEHPRGDAEIAFNVAIDENNELSANIIDEETGAESKTTIELVNRTIEERMADEIGDYDIAETSVPEDEVIIEEEPVEEETVESPVEENKEEGDAVAAGSGLLAAAMLMNEGAEEASAEEVPVDESSEENIVEEEPSFDIPGDFELEDFSLDETETALADDPVIDEAPAEEEPVVEEAPAEETETFENSDFELPDFTEDKTEDTISAEEEAAMWDEPVEEDSSSLFDLPDFEEEQVVQPAQDVDMDWDFDEELTRAENTDYSENSSGSGLSFTGLYDKETELGDYEEEASENKKRKTSVVICIICAIICILAVLLILFVIPSKLNILKRGQTAEKETAVEMPVEEEPVVEPVEEPEPVPETSAKEDEIVIIEEAEEIKPEPPAPPKEEPKPDIIYKIKWGDTLWDIADTYYKNPWRYKKIARYNGIKDPDYIISGTRIKIPQE